MPKQIREGFLREVIQASGEKRDYRFSQWAKWVDGVNPKGTNGYAFEGPFINEGTLEIDVWEPRVILVSTCSGSRKYQTRHYRIVVLEADGTLRCTDIGTDDSTPGWALRIRDQVAALLKEIQGQPAPIVTPEEVLSFLKVLPLLTAAGITVVDFAFNDEEVEVKYQGERDWFHADEAAEFIAVKIMESLND